MDTDPSQLPSEGFKERFLKNAKEEKNVLNPASLITLDNWVSKNSGFSFCS